MSSTNRAKKRVESKSTKEIKELLKLGVPGTEIAKRLGCAPSKVYSIKAYHKAEIDSAKVLNKDVDISNYEDLIATNLKSNILRVSNTISNKDIQKASLSQLSTSMAIMIDKLRLIEGKSTANVSTRLLAAIEPEQLEIIKESIKSLKESMLK